MDIGQLQQAVKDDNIDELLDVNTPSKPAVMQWESRMLYRIHLQEDDPRLPEAKRQIKEIKAQLKQQLYELYGDEWKVRMPHDYPLSNEVSFM
jgi:hypothetical protein